MLSRAGVSRALSYLVAAQAVVLVVYQLLDVWFTLQPVSRYYSLFFGAVFSMSVFMALQEMLDARAHWAKIALLCLALVAGLSGPVYLWLNTSHLETAAGLLDPRDVVIGLVSLAGIIVAGFFTWGGILTAVVCLALAYFAWGDHIPGFLGHTPYTVEFIVSYTTLHPVHGIYWLIPLTAEVVFYVLLFSSVLAHTGAIGALLEIGKAVGRRVSGGAAYPAVVGSALVGTMVGQAVANVVITGRITIPQMKKQGFKPEMAAAIETSASTGSLIMPPIMGLGAFVMAFFLNVSYIAVALAATIPAILYYAGVAVGVYFYAKANGVERIREVIDWPLVVRVLPTFVISLGVLTALMLLMYTPRLAGFWALAVTVVVPFVIQGRYRPKLRAVWDGLLDGARTAAKMGLLLALIGPVAQTVITSGLGPSVANALVLSPVGKIAAIALPLVMICTLICGAVIPEAATYIIMALALAPFLEELGYSRVASHMFVFYYSIFATIIPPVAITAMTAAQLAGANFMETSVRAMKLAFIGLFVPYVFIFNTTLLDFPRFSLAQGLSLILCLLGMVGLAASWWGWLARPLTAMKRIFVGLAGAACMIGAAVPP